MCGISGIFAYADHAPSVDIAELLRTRDQMASRGPDGAGQWLDPEMRLGLAHRRLAIIDLTPGGAQPMSSADGRYHITFNGEIYNYLELRDELTARGCVFRSRSDTEVLLHLYAEHGEGMCGRLRGMFAFAIWDWQERSLFLARDPFGMKPLYLHDDGRTLRFASQVKALLAGGAISKEIEPAGEAGFWVWGFVPEPWTLYRNVLALEPGTWLRVMRGGVRETGVFASVESLLREGEQPPPSPREVLLDSVRKHLIADVPVGVFLSSGIDSSTLLALASGCTSGLRSLTLGFEEYRGTAADETVIAEQVARRYGVRHDTVWVTGTEFEEGVHQFVDAMDQPTVDGLNTWMVSRAAARVGLKVALSGLGGDEMFAGYPSFRQLPRAQQLLRPRPVVRGLGKLLRRTLAPMLRFQPGAEVTRQVKAATLLEYGGTWDGAYLLRRAMRMPWELHRSLDDFAFPTPCPEDLPDQLKVTWMEATRYMRNQLLRDSDWASMAHSVELRLPFVDVAVARAVGVQARLGDGWRKRAIASAAPGLPRNVTDRKKTGFSVPVGAWARGPEVSHRERRGFRFWQERIAATNVYEADADFSAAPGRAIALWSPEMASRGGIQSYMWRIWEVLTDCAGASGSGDPRGLSLNDTTDALAGWPVTAPGSPRPKGTKRSKVRFILKALTSPGASEVIVGHLHLAPVALVALLLGRIDRYHVVLHGIEAWRRRTWLERMALRHAKRIVSTSNYTAEACATANGTGRAQFRILPLCAERSPEPPDPSFALDGAWPILFVGRLEQSERYKGLESVIQAVNRLLGRATPVKLHVIGDGDDRPWFESIVHGLGLDERHVRFHGRVSDAMLQAAYMSAKAFVMPSGKEGFGIVFLEAMRHGTPCIGGAQGGTPEVFRSGSEGELVAVGDVEILTITLGHLYDDPGYATKIGEGGRRRFAAEYTAEQFRRRWRRMLSEANC